MAKPALPRRPIPDSAPRYAVFVPPNGDPTTEFPDPPFREYWPAVEAHLRFATQDTGNVENYVVCWREVEALEDPLFGNLGELPLRSWTRATAVRVLGVLSNKADGKPRSLSTLSCKVNAMAAVFRRATSRSAYRASSRPKTRDAPFPSLPTRGKRSRSGRTTAPPRPSGAPPLRPQPPPHLRERPTRARRRTRPGRKASRRHPGRCGGLLCAPRAKQQATRTRRQPIGRNLNQAKCTRALGQKLGNLMLYQLSYSRLAQD